MELWQVKEKKEIAEGVARVQRWLNAALAKIDGDYIQLPVAGREDPIYRERVYCYELYHRWRCCWKSNFGYSLCGEIDKGGHQIIHGGEKPDFLVHVPGSSRNLLVLEVKPANGATNGIVKDLQTLTKFRRDLKGGHKYAAAVLLIYGLKSTEWPKKRKAIRGAIRKSVGGVKAPKATIDLSLIEVLIHEGPGHSATAVSWAD